ncbi:MAG TPA: DUF935 family protein [Vicinamibacterales bacterium]|nr:DUF935 family protein [Vicinamibacterales bacterium]
MSTKKPTAWKTRSSREAKDAAAWIEGSNPLRGMTLARAIALYDSARRGDTVHLQWLYNEIESADPTLMVCADRRSGAIATLDWTIRSRKPSRVRGWDEKLAAEQTAMLEAEYGRADQANLTTAVEHLAGAMFRGFAHVAPLYTPDGLGLQGFDILDGWNFRRDIATGEWLWNPNGYAYERVKLDAIPRDELASVVRSRHIDYPALSIYLRAALGEKAWGQFLERYGIPPVIIVMPPDIPPEKEQLYLDAAEKVAQGASGALPNGASASYATEARGTDPFTAFLDHQQKLIVLMATGGLATSLETAQGLGSGTSDAHSDTWRAVWLRDSIVISDALNRGPTRLLLDRAFPGLPHLAYFAFDAEPARSPGEIFDDAGKARAAGYTIDRAQLEEKTGYTLIPYEAPTAPAIVGSVLHRRDPEAEAEAERPRKPVAKPLQNARKPEDVKTPAQDEPPQQNANAGLLEQAAKSLSADLKPVGERVAALLALPEAERAAAARALAAELPDLLPADPEMAAVFEAALADAFAIQVQEEPKS